MAINSGKTGDGGKNGGKNGEKESCAQLTEKLNIILDTINKNPAITINDLSKTLAVKKRTLERDIAELQKCGILKREGSKKNGVWIIVR
jgi:ATP-dependent DNA helicase RecG